jgi:signal transduction histidine kinase
MSHELRTPLNAILNFTRFLDKERYGALTERQQELQQRVLANSEHLLGLINDILDLSKIEIGKFDLVYEQIDLAPILHSVAATAAGLTRNRGLALTLDCPPTLPPVLADKTRIRQVLLNLISNATKFTNAGVITISAAVAGDTIRIAVQDTGIGIAPEHYELIFDEFRQLQSSPQGEHQGSGLGLAISRRLVEMHSGRLLVESAMGVGSTFSFTLPIAAAPWPEPAPPPAPPGASGGARPTIVVVDDDNGTQEILRQYLEADGYAVVPVIDSRYAVEQIRRSAPTSAPGFRPAPLAVSRRASCPPTSSCRNWQS